VVAVLGEVQPELGKDDAASVPRLTPGVSAHLWRDPRERVKSTLAKTFEPTLYLASQSWAAFLSVNWRETSRKHLRRIWASQTFRLPRGRELMVANVSTSNAGSGEAPLDVSARRGVASLTQSHFRGVFLP
jgi:hypothetical protein